MSVRLDEKSADIIDKMARVFGRPKTDIVSMAIERFWRQWVIEETNKAYAELAADPQKWEEEQSERSLWDNTLKDGL